MTDFVVMVEKAGTMFVTGPDVVKTVLGEEIIEDLGGAITHGSKSGVAHFVAQNEYECMDQIKKLISFYHKTILNKKKLQLMMTQTIRQ